MITFVPLLRSDLPLLARWLAEPRVARWWHHETSAAAVERDFGPSLDGADVTRLFLAHTAAGPFGLIQRYPIHAYPEYAQELAPVCELPAGVLSIDYLIGEPASRGRGQGTAMITAFVRDSFRHCPAAGSVVVPVHAANRASWRALEGAGFRRVATGELEPDNPVDSRDHYVYRVDRPPT